MLLVSVKKLCGKFVCRYQVYLDQLQMYFFYLVLRTYLQFVVNNIIPSEVGICKQINNLESFN